MHCWNHHQHLHLKKVRRSNLVCSHHVVQIMLELSQDQSIEQAHPSCKLLVNTFTGQATHIQTSHSSQGTQFIGGGQSHSKKFGTKNLTYGHCKAVLNRSAIFSKASMTQWQISLCGMTEVITFWAGGTKSTKDNLATATWSPACPWLHLNDQI